MGLSRIINSRAVHAGRASIPSILPAALPAACRCFTSASGLPRNPGIHILGNTNAKSENGNHSLDYSIKPYSNIFAPRDPHNPNNLHQRLYSSSPSSLVPHLGSVDGQNGLVGPDLNRPSLVPGDMKTVIQLSRLEESDLVIKSVVPHVSSLAMQEQTLPDWAGADREILVHKSLTEMEPIGVTMLSGKMFNAPIRMDLVHEVVRWQRRKRRQGTSKTKGRWEVAYSGRKLRPQKGSGRARMGDRGAPHLYKGGDAHPKRPQDWSYPLSVDVRRNGLRSMLSEKYRQGKLWVVNSAEIERADTQILIDSFVKLGWYSVMIVDYQKDKVKQLPPNLDQAQFPLENVLLMHVQGMNVYDMMSFHHLVFTIPALRKFEQRCMKYKNLY